MRTGARTRFPWIGGNEGSGKGMHCGRDVWSTNEKGESEEVRSNGGGVAGRGAGKRGGRVAFR
jgi:hypothetical protein